MADPDTNYISNADISAYFFNGETVPDAATILETPNLKLKQMVDKYINSLLRVTTNQTDTFGDFLLAAIILYGQALNGDILSLPLEDINKLKNRNRQPNISFHNPTNYQRT